MKRIIAVAAVALFSTAAGAQSINVQLSEFKMKMSRDTVKAGSVRLQVTNVGEMSHAVHVRGPEGATGKALIDKETTPVARGQASGLTLTLAPGTYEVYCPLAEGSHKMAGMTAKLVVTAAPEAKAAKKP